MERPDSVRCALEPDVRVTRGRNRAGWHANNECLNWNLTSSVAPRIAFNMPASTGNGARLQLNLLLAESPAVHFTAYPLAEIRTEGRFRACRKTCLYFDTPDDGASK